MIIYANQELKESMIQMSADGLPFFWPKKKGSKEVGLRGERPDRRRGREEGGERSAAVGKNQAALSAQILPGIANRKRAASLYSPLKIPLEAWPPLGSML